MPELTLMKRDELEKIFEPCENILHKDVELGGNAKIRFRLTDVEKVQNVPHISINGEEYPLTSSALLEAARTVGVPQAYANRCPSEMIFPHLEHWFGLGGSGKARFFLQNNIVIGCTANTPSYHTNMEILDNVEKVLKSEEILGYHNPSSSLDHSVFSIIVNRNFEAITGDRLFGGIEVQNSVIGERSIEIAPFIFRQVCTNGMIVSESIGRWSRKGDENFGLWAQSATTGSVQRIEGEFHRIKKLTEVPVGERADNTLRSLFLKFGIPTRTQKEIVGEAASMNAGEGPKTMYDIWNSVTRVATHSPKLSLSSARELRCVAGDLVREVSICDHCGSLYES